MLPYLPADLIEEVLSRVSAALLKRLRSTCKRWNALFKDQRFTEKHFRKAPKRSRVLIFRDCKFCSMSFNLNVSPPSVEFKTALSLKGRFHSDSEQVRIHTAFHCDGLLLCYTVDKRLVVLESMFGRNVVGPTQNSLQGIFSIYCREYLGYETKESCRRNYKILRYWVDYQRGGHVFGFEVYDVFGFEVYEFSSDSWRNLDDVILDFIQINGSVSLKGNTYLHTFARSVISFDYTTDRFKRHCFPQTMNCHYIVLSVVRDEQLSVLCQRSLSSMIEIWLSNKIDRGNEDLVLEQSLYSEITYPS